jgi:hypothetical protein
MLLIILSLIFPLLILAQSQQNNQISLSFEDNYRLYPSGVSQTEVFIVNHPTNHNILFSSCNTLNFIPFFISEGIYVTSNGGDSWYGSDTCKGDPIPFHGGDPGIAIDKNGTFIITRLGRSPFVGLYSHYSNDNGLTWSAQQVISTDDLERAVVESDVNPASPFNGRTYAAWVKFALPFPLMLAYTDDGAQSWTNPMQINTPSNRSAGGDIAIGPNGEVYCCWAGVTESSPFKEILVGFAYSNNGGEVWTVDENAFEVNGITGILENKGNIRVNGLPNITVDTTSGPRQGWIYIVTGEKDMAPAGSDPDILLHRSEDGGQTWSSGIRVNQDEMNNGKEQYFPALHVDRFGAVNVLFYDDRHTSSDSAAVFLARSTDGGDSWTEWEISNHRFKPEPIGGLGQGYQGDNIDITSTDSHLWPVWMDNSTGIYQVWTSPLSFSVINDIRDEYIPSDYGITSIYPNPSRGISHFSIHISQYQYVTLKLFDLQGREVATIVDTGYPAGKHTVRFDAGFLPPGVYLCRLAADGKFFNERIIIIK